jgi:hypothetical protein
MAIINTQLTTTATTTVYTSSGSSAITTAYICNTSGTDVTANVFVVPSAGTAGPANQIYSFLPLAGYDTYVMEAERLLMSGGDTLQIEASAGNSLTATVSYTGI